VVLEVVHTTLEMVAGAVPHPSETIFPLVVVTVLTNLINIVVDFLAVDQVVI
jgi:hypothetical protein